MQDTGKGRHDAPAGQSPCRRGIEDEAGIAWVAACPETDEARSKAGRNYHVAGIRRP
jgi:hypothetical protein